jgi:two-component system LytT family response regulator
VADHVIPISVCIVDDEPPARRALEWLLSKHPDVVVVGSCGDGAAAVTLIQEHRPDVVFLDVQMPGGDGFDVLEALASPSPAVVFVTAFDTYAVRAFDVRAVDYLVKPFSDERFALVLSRAREVLARKLPPPAPLVVKDGHRTYVLPTHDIEWIESEDYYVRIHAGHHQPLVRRTMQSMLESLEPLGFVRVHRSAAVNLQHVRQVRPLPSGDADVVLAGGQVVRLSRSHKAAFQARLSVSSAP